MTRSPSDDCYRDLWVICLYLWIDPTTCMNLWTPRICTICTGRIWISSGSGHGKIRCKYLMLHINTHYSSSRNSPCHTRVVNMHFKTISGYCRPIIMYIIRLHIYRTVLLKRQWALRLAVLHERCIRLQCMVLWSFYIMWCFRFSNLGNGHQVAYSYSYAHLHPCTQI